MEYNDYELVYFAMENDDDAFCLILKKYENIIYKLCQYYTGRFYNYSIDLDDLVQECRLNLYYSIKNYNPDKDILFYSFVVLVTKRKIFNIINKSYKKLPYMIELDSDDNYLQLPSDNVNEPSYLALEEEIQEKLIKFKYNLDFMDSVIFDMKYSSFSYDEISKVLDISIKQVDNRLTKIRNKLKKYLLSL